MRYFSHLVRRLASTTTGDYPPHASWVCTSPPSQHPLKPQPRPPTSTRRRPNHHRHLHALALRAGFSSTNLNNNLVWWCSWLSRQSNSSRASSLSSATLKVSGSSPG
ncbi:uncharacterized protein CLUP02_13251 [Colletotrichum lupini]|uniref:Uncharacterized protein n=1 Tax=Colletotrichum lupini TaxID=145971 RepID=A0A9Q8T221_9PEZI|nr:uncharacterized protein CLUP02_13251 [Colletotrichum lupini]UQC87732.1 hypothetical protein CLUP02_13251 [Colletotrichum lupini]